MRVAIDLPAALEQACVPAMILQPLVENAVRHGVARATGITTVRIAAAAASARLELSRTMLARPGRRMTARRWRGWASACATSPTG